ncbi:uncharacterized protein CANTADRAFT_19541 [Suhomyces tanzawaensis NRRL Y-17324]|uniref:Uncharacterized protein n=1 Tax=Suhomyces tanzawaensis NRRL Y-17324 TaxID=984487 RepID=A0A1E4SR16_9ASCO|nr:uncharacterized protein CANTADRAFT_19541 [Suhomyces tanzawaensis NRRL Y-17324]ODV81938.1 hypothetical protein CANTADRAFT_19541 [Suhomyces tanzawaensis NRRL Y-17324]
MSDPVAPPQLPRRVSSVTAHGPPQTKSSRARSASSVNELSLPPKPHGTRNHASSISSVDSSNLDNIIKQDLNPYASQFNGFPSWNGCKHGKIKLKDDIDIEKQLILTAGGKREDVFCFALKLLLLMAIVLGSGVLIFLAL